MSSPADLAGNVGVGVSFAADLAGGVAVGAAPSAVAEVASSADLARDVIAGCGILGRCWGGVFADFAGDVTVSVVSLADPASVVTAAVAFTQKCGNSVVIPSDCVRHYGDIAEVASSADLARDVTVGVTCLVDPVSVVTTGVPFSKECGDSVMVPSGSVCDYDDYFLMDIMTISRTILTMMIRVTKISLVCMALVDWIIMSHIMICMARMAVGYIVYLGAMSVWCHTGV